jgi:hypothetical protein
MEQSASSPQPDPADRLTEARRILAEDEDARMQSCAEEIQAVLAKHGMRLDVTPARITILPDTTAVQHHPA